MKTLVMGASPKPSRYSYLAVNMLKEYENEVVAVGRREHELEDWQILSGQPDIDDLHTITLYMNARHQQEYYDYFMSLNPERIIFNPGAENPELRAMAIEKGIEAVEACTLVMLRTGQY